MRLLPDQIAAVEWSTAATPSARVLAWQGPAGTGKTLGGGLAVLTRMSQYRDRQVVILGQSRKAIHRNITPKLKQLARMAGAHWRGGWDKLEIGRNEYHLFGASRLVADPDFEGMDSAVLWADEATLLQRDLLERAIGRFRGDPPLVLLTFNAASRSHWLRTDWLAEGKVPHVYLRSKRADALDYGILSRESATLQEATMSGHRRARLIDDEWADATGRCVPSLEHSECQRGPYAVTYAGVDWGTSKPTAAEFVGMLSDETWEHAAEYYHDPDREGYRLTAGQHADAIIEQGESLDPPCSLYVVDASAEPLRLELQLRGANAIDAERDVLARINRLEEGYASGALRACQCHAPDLLREGDIYIWDERAREDKPLKKHDHAVDADGYIWQTIAEPTLAGVYERPEGL